METTLRSEAWPDPVAETLTGLLAGSVARFAGRPAVSDDQQSLTYAELDRRSDVLAAALRARGVGAEDRVGLYIDRSVDVFVAVLGILKSGGAYVAVDARYPDARRDLMLTDSGAKLVLTRPEWQNRLSHLGLALHPYRSEPTANAIPVDAAVADGAASVLFTSGSSGLPKAIVLEHRNIVSFARNRRLPALRPDDRTGQISSLSFDAFHFEMWSTLAQGAEAVILPPVPELLAADFQRELKRRRITAMLVPTMVVNHVVREDRDAFAPLRILQTGGDVLLPSSCRDLLSGGFEGELYNLYGPAEITTACTAQRVTAREAELDSVPIGTPLEGVVTYVLTPELLPVEHGATGELFVGGPGVARGYLDAPALTDERFVANPVGDEPSRLYRTGDLVRELADGNLEFVGRADSQVKIRGYRVEPGEVERSLRQHAQVHEAVVLPCGEGDSRRLVAFVVLDGTPALKDVRAHAESALPDFMVPGHFVAVPRIPASENGKRDLEALQVLLDEHRLRQDGHVAPATETERRLAVLWEALLGVEKIGAQEDFFSLGGHSLLALRMQNRIKREFGVSLEYRDLLARPVLADLAAEIEDARGEVDFA
ncbi:amino acid adenylation domain-containing protein [Streptomyces sp. NPDC059104]|uniref:non-ribosomal peptide synthetase n=1 Tax=Streptomyces sp. NPDC059104 TaxID=3346729 RepID=UPI003688BEA8